MGNSSRCHDRCIPGQRYGRRDSLRVVAIFYVVSVLGCAFTWNVSSLLFFRFIGRLGIGGTSVLGPMYIAELAPTRWRGRLVGFFQVNVVLGILLAYCSNYLLGDIAARLRRMALAARDLSRSHASLCDGSLFIPRSPRWLTMQMRYAEAHQVLLETGAEHPEAELLEIRASIENDSQGAGDSLTARRYPLPFYLALTVGMFCQLTGINAVLYYLNDIFAMAGASKMSGNLQALAVGAVNMIATLIAMSVIDKFGRRKLLLIGTAGLAVCLSVIGILFFTHTYLNWLTWLLMTYVALLAISHGAVVWVYISEVFPTRVRAKGQSLGSSSHWTRMQSSPFCSRCLRLPRVPFRSSFSRS